MDELFNVEEKVLFEELRKRLVEMCERLNDELRLPPRSIRVGSVIGKGKDNQGQLITVTVNVAEPYQPFAFDEQYDSLRTDQTIVSLSSSKTKDKSYCTFSFSSRSLEGLKEPVSVSRKEKDGNIELRISLTDTDSFVAFVSDYCKIRIRHFHSGLGDFGCCDKYRECSKVGKCLHKNQLFSTACLYRKNLLNGKVFYND